MVSFNSRPLHLKFRISPLTPCFSSIFLFFFSLTYPSACLLRTTPHFLLLLSSTLFFLRNLTSHPLSFSSFSSSFSSGHRRRRRLLTFEARIEHASMDSSFGLKTFVPSVDLVVRDCLSFFRSIKQDPNFNGLRCFLYGESMGGAIFLIHFEDPNGFDDAILAAPMSKISDKVTPRWPIPQILTFLARFFSTWAMFLAPDLLFKSVKVDQKKMIADMNPMR